MKPDCEYSLTDDGHLSFKGQGGNLGSEREYILELDFFKPIKAEDSKINVTARTVAFKIEKAASGPYWDRLEKQEGRNVHCSIDWDNWRDEDEDDDEYAFGSQFTDNKDLSDMDFGAGEDDDDEDDDDDDDDDVNAMGTPAVDLPTGKAADAKPIDAKAMEAAEGK